MFFIYWKELFFRQKYNERSGQKKHMFFGYARL